MDGVRIDATVRAELLCSFAAALLLCFITPGLPLFDLCVYWKASAQLVGGENPYNLPADVSYMTDIPAQLHEATLTLKSRIWGPPIVFAPIFWIGYLPLQVVKGLFVLFFYAGACAGWLIAARLYGGSARNLWVAMYALFIFPVGAWFFALSWGSPTWIPMIAILAFLHLYSRERYLASGAVLSVCVLKPHLFLLLFLLVFLIAVRDKAFGSLIGFGVVAVLLSAVVLLHQPDAMTMYREFISVENPYHLVTASLPNVLSAFFVTPQLWLLYGPLLLAAVCLAFRVLHGGVGEMQIAVPLILPFSLLLSPSTWGHDYIACLPLLLLARRQLLESIAAGDRDLTFRFTFALFCCALTEKYLGFQPFFTHAFPWVLYGVGLALLSYTTALSLKRGTRSESS